MERLRDRATELLAGEEPVVMAGDYNIIPQDIDAAKPAAWVDDALALPEARAAFRQVLAQGWADALRLREPGPGVYSFWDYQAGAWERGNGIRIDHLLLSPEACDLLQDTGVDAHIRGREKPSDHVPVWITLDA
jgi:exodeoxyribonuclease-3